MSDSQPRRDTRPRVAVVDACTLTRSMLQQAHPAVHVVSAHATPDGLLANPVSLDLVILDLALAADGSPAEGNTGATAVRALVERGYRVCVHTNERRPLVLARCLHEGASGIALKSDPLEASQGIFLAVAAGRTEVAPTLRGTISDIQRRGGPPVLTVRQQQVLYGRARGANWQIVADGIGISAKTAYDRLEAVRIKMSGFLDIAGLSPDCSPADIERAIAHTPSDLLR